MLHGTEVFTYICHKDQPNVRRCIIGSYGIARENLPIFSGIYQERLGFSSWRVVSLPEGTSTKWWESFYTTLQVQVSCCVRTIETTFIFTSNSTPLLFFLNCLRSHCWWKKACTTWYLGFFPSTVLSSWSRYNLYAILSLESALNGLQGRRQNRDREPFKTKVVEGERGYLWEPTTLIFVFI